MRLTLDLDSKKDIFRELQKYGKIEVWKSASAHGRHYIIKGLTKEQVVELRLKFDDLKRVAMDNLRTPLSRNVLFTEKRLYKGREIYKEFHAAKLKDANDKTILEMI
uniref:Uncharacterized protein n=1 Tax=viral metagenome TaxID=1070528 RepID=A0A6H1ZNA4_9ZZZZ